jgi:hypothetical protein
MRLPICFFYLLLYTSIHAQDSTNQKHPLFKLSGIATLGGGGGSNLNYINGKNQNYPSKQTLLSMWPAFANKPFYNYTQWQGNYSSNGSAMFGAYLNFDNYSKKKNKYAIHSQTNVGITIISFNSFSPLYSNIKATRLDTLYQQEGANYYYPAAYYDNVTTNNASVNYHSTSLGIDVQQLFNTNQKKIISFFAGVGFTTNFSVVSQITYWEYQQSGINLTTNTINSYQVGGNYNLTNKTISATEYGNDKIKNSVLYQLYIPFGFNIRLGKNDRKTISHFYFTTQARLGFQLLKITDVNAFIYTTRYITFGVKYKF